MTKKQNNKIKVPSYRINEQIIVNCDVRLVGEGVESRLVSIKEARAIASDMGMDLIEINRNAPNPVVKVDNYEKMLYKMKKEAKKSAHNAKPVKEIQLKPNIALNDLKTKANNARKFLEDGSKVKVVLMMKGRELLRREENKKPILQFIVMLEDVAVPEFTPRDEGNKTIVTLKKKN